MLKIIKIIKSRRIYQLEGNRQGEGKAEQSEAAPSRARARLVSFARDFFLALKTRWLLHLLRLGPLTKPDGQRNCVSGLTEGSMCTPIPLYHYVAL
jgi:hypothetical protein